MSLPVDRAWRRWVRSCVILGGWLAAASLFWLALLVRAWTEEGVGLSGSGPLALGAGLGLVDVALVGNLGRWWLKPRWPGRAPRGWWPTLTDPLGLPLPTVTAATVVGNALLVFAGGLGAADWVSLLLCVGGLLLLAGVVVRSPRRTVEGVAP